MLKEITDTYEVPLVFKSSFLIRPTAVRVKAFAAPALKGLSALAKVRKALDIPVLTRHPRNRGK